MADARKTGAGEGPENEQKRARIIKLHDLRPAPGSKKA